MDGGGCVETRSGVCGRMRRVGVGEWRVVGTKVLKF